MDFQVSKLREALDLLDPVVPRKPSVKVLDHVRLGDGKAIASDLEVAVTVSGLGDSAGEGVCLEYKTLAKLLAAVPGRETLHIALDGNKANLTAGMIRAQLSAVPAADFPPIPDFTPEHEAAVDGDSLIRALTTVLPCAAVEKDRPVLNSVCLVLGETPEAAAADGFRLAWEPIPIKLSGEGNLLIPTGTVGVLAHLWRRAPKPPELSGVDSPARLATAKRLVRLEWSRDRLRVTFGEVSLLSQLIQGSFPDYRKLIPDPASAASATFDAADLVRVVKGMAQVARETSGIIRLRWGNGELRVEARAEDVGTVSAAIPALCQGEGKTAYNVAYLLEYLKGKEGTVTLATKSPSDPGLFSHRGSPNMCLMPMFVQWEEDKPTGAAPAQETTSEAGADTELEAEPEGPTEEPELDAEPEGPTEEIDPEPPKEKPRRKRKAKAAKEG